MSISSRANDAPKRECHHRRTPVLKAGSAIASDVPTPAREQTSRKSPAMLTLCLSVSDLRETVNRDDPCAERSALLAPSLHRSFALAPRVDHEPVAFDARERSVGELGAEEADTARRRRLIETGDEPLELGRVRHLDRPAVELGVAVDEIEVDRRGVERRTEGRAAGRPPCESRASSPARARRCGTRSRSR